MNRSLQRVKRKRELEKINKEKEQQKRIERRNLIIKISTLVSILILIFLIVSTLIKADNFISNISNILNVFDIGSPHKSIY